MRNMKQYKVIIGYCNYQVYNLKVYNHWWTIIKNIINRLIHFYWWLKIKEYATIQGNNMVLPPLGITIDIIIK